MAQLTGVQMKYLHVIYGASVSRMIKLLVNMGLISVQEYGKIELTARGKSEGSAIHSRVLGLREPEATDSAYSFLSGFSAHCVDALLQKGWTKKPDGCEVTR